MRSKLGLVLLIATMATAVLGGTASARERHLREHRGWNDGERGWDGLWR